MAFSGWYPSSYIRMPYSGIANNNVIWPWHVGDLYYEVSGIEQVIGFNPLNGYPSLTARISGLELRDFIDMPPSTTDGNIALFSGTTGRGLKTSALNINSDSITSLDGFNFIQLPNAGTDMQFASILASKGMSFLLGNNSGINIATVGGDEYIAPFADNQGNLGMPGKQWKNIYVGDIYQNGALLNAKMLSSVLSGNTLPTNASQVPIYSRSGENEVTPSQILITNPAGEVHISGLEQQLTIKALYVSLIGENSDINGNTSANLYGGSQAQVSAGGSDLVVFATNRTEPLYSGTAVMRASSGIQLFDATGKYVFGSTIFDNMSPSIIPAMTDSGTIGVNYSRWLSGYIQNIESLSGYFDRIIPLSAGNSFVGSAAQTFKTGYFDGIMLNGVTLSPSAGGLTGPVSSVNNGIATWNGTAGTALLNNNVTLSLNILSGLSGIMPGQSGVNSVGSASMPFSTGYFNTIILNGASLVTANGDVTGGNASTNNEIVRYNGTTGKAIQSGSRWTIDNTGLFSPLTSGTQSIGTSGLYLSGVFTNRINTALVTKVMFMEEPTGLVNGINSGFTLVKAPYGTSLALFKNGLLMLPSGVHSSTFDYRLAGVNITFYTPPVSGSTLIAQSYSYLG